MEVSEWVNHLRKHLAVASVGNSTLMKQSGKERVVRAQRFLIRSMKLDKLATFDETKFKSFLSAKTRALSKELPRPVDLTPNWGAARKVINIYLRLCAMNKDINDYYELSSIEPYLEVPLDNHIVEKIDEELDTEYLKYFKIITLSATENRKLQNCASQLALEKGLYRYELDVLYWNSKKINA